jgi:hypothetical protein
LFHYGFSNSARFSGVTLLLLRSPNMKTISVLPCLNDIAYTDKVCPRISVLF